MNEFENKLIVWTRLGKEWWRKERGKVRMKSNHGGKNIK